MLHQLNAPIVVQTRGWFKYFDVLIYQSMKRNRKKNKRVNEIKLMWWSKDEGSWQTPQTLAARAKENRWLNHGEHKQRISSGMILLLKEPS